jgi:hypothetical protein
VSRARAAVLMRTFGTGRTGNVRPLPRTPLIRQLRTRRKGVAFSGDVERRERMMANPRLARLSGIRVRMPATVVSAKLAGVPDGVRSSPAGLRVQFDNAKEAVRLFALAQVLTNDFESFEKLVLNT